MIHKDPSQNNPIPIDATILTDGTITLHPIATQYSPGMTAAVLESLESLSPWMSWATPGYTERENTAWITLMRQHWERGLAYQFVMLDPKDGTLIGGCGLNYVHISDGFGNLDYWVRTSRRRQGFAARAIRLVARFAFEKVGLLRVDIIVAADNHASLHTAEKAGARSKGALHNSMVVGDQVYSTVVHSLIPEDFGLMRPKINDL